MYNLFTIQHPLAALSVPHPFENSVIALALIVIVLSIAMVGVRFIYSVVKNSAHRTRILFLSAIAFQFLGLATMAAPHVYTLTTGKEIVLRSVPVDPRDLFRGDYVTLSYPFARNHKFNDGDIVWVVFSEAADGWKADKYLSQPPAELKPGQVAIHGKVEYGAIECGIEQFFVPEGSGRALERAKYLNVKVMVDNFSNAVVTDVKEP